LHFYCIRNEYGHLKICGKLLEIAFDVNQFATRLEKGGFLEHFALADRRRPKFRPNVRPTPHVFPVPFLLFGPFGFHINATRHILVIVIVVIIMVIVSRGAGVVLDVV